MESAILWDCAGYFALKYSTRQRAGAEFMPITKLELAPHHGDFAGMCMLYHTHQKRGRAAISGPKAACGRRALWPPDRLCHKSR